MRFPGFHLATVARLDDDIYRPLGDVVHPKPSDIRTVSAAENAELVRNCVLFRCEEEFNSFLIAKHSLRQFTERFDDVHFLLAPLPLSGRLQTKSIAFEQFPHARALLRPEINPNRKEVALELESCWAMLVHPPFEEADEAIAAMVSLEYPYSSMPLFSKQNQEPEGIIEALASANDGAEFRRIIMRTFPLLIRFDKGEMSASIITKDKVLVQEMCRALGKASP